MAARLNSSGTIQSADVYNAFGGLLSGGSTDSQDPYGYKGQFGYYTDRGTGGAFGGQNLQVLGHRYYDPSRGRFLTRDPIGYAGGMNLYAYTANNPTSTVDPSGLWGVQIGENGPNIGWGDPTWTFTAGNVVDGIAVGTTAVADTFLPSSAFGDYSPDRQ